jgi:hypothetical protein
MARLKRVMTPAGTLLPESPLPEAIPEAATPPAAVPTAEVVPSVPPETRRWCVIEEVRIVIRGGFTTLHAGKILDEMHYSPDTIEDLRQQGVKLEAVIE